MDALQMARDAMDVSEVKDFTPEQAMFLYAQAQAFAAIAQVEATRGQTAELKRIAKALCMDNDLTVIDAIYALVEVMNNRP